MNSQFSQLNNKRLQEKAKESFSLKYRFNKGALFSAAKWVEYIIGAVYSVLLLAQVMGLWLLSGDKQKTSDSYAQIIYDLRITLVCLLLIVVALIFLRLKKYIISGALIILEGALFLPRQSFENVLIDGAWKPIVFFTLPTVVLLVIGAYSLICRAAELILIKREYNDLVRRFIATYPTAEDRLTTAEEWDKHIEAFLSEPIHQKPKKSVKRRAQKQGKLK